MPVPVDSVGDLTGTQLVESLAFCRLALADVLVEHVDGGPVAVDEGFEPAAWIDGIELVVVTD